MTTTSPATGSTKISKLGAASTPLGGSEIFPGTQSGVTKAVSATMIAEYANSFNSVVNVKGPAYGAKGDGSTNDTAAIQAALNYVMVNGGILYFPPGRYCVTGLTATWSNHGAMIVGAHYDSTNGASQIDFIGSAQGSALTLLGASGVHSIVVEDLIFNNTTSNDAYGVRLQSWRDAVFFRCRFDGFTHASNTAAGVWLDAKSGYASVANVSEFNYFVECYFNNCRHNIFATLAGINNIFIDKCRFLAATNIGIYQKAVTDATLGLTYSHHWVIRDCWNYCVDSNTSVDMSFESGMKSLLIDGCYFEYNGSTGKAQVKLGAGKAQHTSFTFSNNWVQGNPANNHGVIQLANCKGVIVRNNTWTQNTGGGSSFVEFTDANVTNFQVDYPGITAGAGMPYALLDSSGNGYVNDRISATSTPKSPDGVLNMQVNSSTGVGNGADATDDTLFTYTLPANTLSETGQSIIVKCWGKLAANGNNKTITGWFGGTQLLGAVAVTYSGTQWIAEMHITRVDGTHVSHDGLILYDGQTNKVNTADGTTAITVSSAAEIKFTGKSGSSAANDVLAFGMSVTANG